MPKNNQVYKKFGIQGRENSSNQLPRIAIVCEDSVNAVRYFEALCEDLRIGPNVKVVGGSDSSPNAVLGSAKASLTDKDSVAYCVIDKDEHSTYKSTIDSARRNRRITAIPSVPCFELWILFHLEYTTAEMNNCAAVIGRIRKESKSFDKKGNDYGVLYHEVLGDLTDTAIKHAKMAKCEKKKTTGGAKKDDFPYTDVHILVEKLRELSKKFQP